MSIFAKKEKQKCICTEKSEPTIMPECSCNSCGKIKVKILGSGCPTCHKQYAIANKAIEKSEIDADVEYITDMQVVASYGVMSMPAIVVNDKVVSYGRLVNEDEFLTFLK